MEYCCPMWFSHLWKSSRDEPPQPKQNEQNQATIEQPILQPPSTGSTLASSPYGTMGSNRAHASLGSLKIPKARALRTERTELTNVSPSSMHTPHTPDPEDIPPDDTDITAFGAQFSGEAVDTNGSFNPHPTNQSEPDLLAGITEITEEALPLTLEEKLWDARIPWPQGRESYFIPYDDIERLVTFDTILAELRRCNVSLDQTELRENAIVINKTARKLFAALVCQTLGECILHFLEEGLSDKDMPFVKVELKKRDPRAGSFRLESRRRRGEVLKCMATPKWTRSKLEGFNRDQWWVLAPIFKESKKEHKQKKVRHWEIEDNRVLPFVEDTESTSENRGGFSEVWAVRIHVAHQRLYKGTNPKNPNPRIAIKRLLSTKESDFKREIEMLKAFSHHSNPHLVKLLATYRYRNRYHLMFPLAAANLRNYWAETKVPEFSYETMRWSLVQCKGIASALKSIHEYENTLPKQPKPEPSTDLEVPSNARHESSPFSNAQKSARASEKTDTEAKYGRHGDIKPENILWSCEDIKDDCGKNDLGILLIADFGLMEFHRESTRSKVPFESIAVSPTYEPPDRRLKVPISRKYDIWSLGCVYLEFITWLVGGVKLLTTFPEARDEFSASSEISDDTFFSLLRTDPKNPNSPISGAIVRPGVTEWIRNLRNKPRNSEFIHDFLDLVENRMLQVNQEDRVSCSQLNTELAGMVEKADKNKGYLTDTKPLDCRPPLGELGEGLKLNVPPSPTEGSKLPSRNSGISEVAMGEQRPMSPELRVSLAND